MAMQGLVCFLLLVGSLADIFEENECLDDNCGVALLQSGVRTQQRIKHSQSLHQHRSAGILNQTVQDDGFDCDKYHHFCQEPFNCQPGAAHLFDTLSIAAGAWTQGLAHDGVNLHSWCAVPDYQDFVHQCLVEKDLVKAGHTQFEKTKSGEFGEFVYLMDGSYCFIEGHCLNTAVTENTTLAEASKMCDDRYGHERWTSFGSSGSKDTVDFIKNRTGADFSNGMSGKEHTTGFLLAACAMGNYHCDVMYCKETYCKQEDLKEKYSHFLYDYGWDKNKESWFTG